MNTGDAAGRLAEQAADDRRVAARRGKTEYALEGSVFIGGAVVQWLRDGLGIIRSRRRGRDAGATVPDNGGVYLVPAFAGLGAPHWDPYARGTIVGLTRGTTAGHIARAALEGIAFQVGRRARGDAARRRHRAGRSCASTAARAANDLLMQFQADLLGVPVVRPTVTETTALGAAYLAGLAVGLLGHDRDDWRSTARGGPALRAGNGRSGAGRRAGAADWSRGGRSARRSWIAPER